MATSAQQSRKAATAKTAKAEAAKEPLRLDLGCGPNKKPGHIGIDKIKFPGVDKVLDIGSARLPYADASVAEVFSSHFLEHLGATERIHVFNEVFRVLKPNGTFTVIVPHWSSSRAYGDPTHQWPPMGEFALFYTNAKWRGENAPHTDAEHWDRGYSCDFDFTWGYSLHPSVGVRSQEYQTFAAQHYKEAVMDMSATLTKVPR